MDGVAVVTFFFKLIFYWPFRILFLFGRWIIEKFQDASYERQKIDSDVRSAQYTRTVEQERRSRNALYGGPKQPDA